MRKGRGEVAERVSLRRENEEKSVKTYTFLAILHQNRHL